MHEEFDELLALRALGALDGDDLRRLEAHLATGCAECARELAELEPTAALLAWGADAAAPPASLRARLLDAVAETPRNAPPAPIPFPERRAPSRSGAFVMAAGLLAAACVAIAVLSAWLVAARSDLDAAVRQLADARDAERVKDERLAKQDRLLGVVNDPDVRLVRLSATDEPPKPGVDVAWNPREQRGVLTARGLPKAGDGKTYELWLIANGAPVPAVVFDTDARGNAVVEIDRLSPDGPPKVFAVTVEPAGGSPAPTTKPILAASYGA